MWVILNNGSLFNFDKRRDRFDPTPFPHRLTDIQVGYYREIHSGEQADFFLGHNPEASADSAVWYAEGRVAGERSFVVRLAFEAC